MNRKIIIAATLFIAAVFSLIYSCDLFSTDSYDEAVAAFNEVDNPLYGNYWKKLTYTGPDLTDLDGDTKVAIVDNVFYLLQDVEYDDVYSDYQFYKVDLEKMVSEKLSEPKPDNFETSGYRTEGFEYQSVEDEIFLAFSGWTTDEEWLLSNFDVLHFDSASLKWESVIDVSVLGSGNYWNSRLFENSGNIYLILTYNHDYETGNETAVFKFDSVSSSFVFKEAVEGDCSAYNSTELIVMKNSSENIECYQYNFTTDSFSLIPVTELRTVDEYNEIYDYTGSYNYQQQENWVLTESMLMYQLHYDYQWGQTSGFGPLVIEYVDFSDDNSLRFVKLDEYDTIGNSLYTGFYDNDIYLLSNSGYEYTDDIETATDTDIYRIDLETMEIKVFDEIPDSGESSFQSAEIFVNDLEMLICQTSHKENFMSDFPRVKYYDPVTQSWENVGYSAQFLWAGWSDSLQWGGFYNGKYYNTGNVGGPVSYNNTIMKYIPPASF
ncbi:MAG: hypothetical protein PQJ61_04925 [Spirochaetales bacterium]|uniref:Uncharacterized protein n=1 Tax=Candidatus Thalassospirochaeta sargassi TaxID=3119039 RepID=A0AAJ1IB95_9SPIO|nr:hypothetical protein [Spirochaetales bacterium]